MSKIDALASGSSANGGPQGGNNTEENAGGKRKTPRREPPSPPLGRAAGAARPTQQAPNNQEAMDAEESTVNRETATAMAQIPKEGELPAILAAITQIKQDTERDRRQIRVSRRRSADAVGQTRTTSDQSSYHYRKKPLRVPEEKTGGKNQGIDRA
ncbi:hypothetical protein HPB52_014765 [Rhipicephalus sanguineus]|uniref:Uncharacterized protein n=1 Tax=Rhipicephalus sanguineus TaxID=34632 RepID=A0A9D4T2J6_RHISA|nr:hypothetical protein HPB52_014765 [Rhipicephalus sanguineus]